MDSTDRAGLPPLTFTPQEATAIAVALSCEHATPVPEAARSALLKVIAAIPLADAEAVLEAVEQARSAHRAAAALRSPSGSPSGSPSSPQQAVIEDAIAGHKVLQIEYADRKGEVSRRVVEPVAYVASGRHWYLVAWCRLRQEGRAFRADRIHRALATGDHAPARSLDDVAADLPDRILRPPSSG